MIVYRELSSLEKDLGFQAKTLYAVSNNLKKHYHTVQLPKKSGGTRTLSVPDELLKSIGYKRCEICHSTNSQEYKTRINTKLNTKIEIVKKTRCKVI